MAKRHPGLSERHHKIMDFLVKFQTDNGYSPSIRQIGDTINVKSTSLIDYYLNQLQEMGYIEREGRISRSIRVKKSATPLGEFSHKIAKYSSQRFGCPGKHDNHPDCRAYRCQCPYPHAYQ